MEALSTLKEMSSQCGVSPQQIIRFGGQSACNASATGRAPAQPLPSALGWGVGGGCGGVGWGHERQYARRTDTHTHTHVLSHTDEGISLNGILSILRCPFLNGTGVKGKDTYVNNMFHIGLSGPVTVGRRRRSTVLEVLIDLNLILSMTNASVKKKKKVIKCREIIYTSRSICLRSDLGEEKLPAPVRG